MPEGLPRREDPSAPSGDPRPTGPDVGSRHGRATAPNQDLPNALAQVSEPHVGIEPMTCALPARSGAQGAGGARLASCSWVTARWRTLRAVHGCPGAPEGHRLLSD